MSHRLPDSAHTSQPWRIHAITRDFKLEDVWELPTPGGASDLDRLVRQFAEERDDDLQPGLAYRLLMAFRLRLGAILGLDNDEYAVGTQVESLRDRLPTDLQVGPRGPDVAGTPFRSLYQTNTEWAAEFANRTVHAVAHFGWIEGADGTYHGQMAALVKPIGLVGRLYFRFIDPFRRVIVLPALIKSIGKKWERTVPPFPSLDGPAN